MAEVTAYFAIWLWSLYQIDRLVRRNSTQINLKRSWEIFRIFEKRYHCRL